MECIWHDSFYEMLRVICAGQEGARGKKNRHHFCASSWRSLSARRGTSRPHRCSGCGAGATHLYS